MQPLKNPRRIEANRCSVSRSPSGPGCRASHRTSFRASALTRFDPYRGHPAVHRPHPRRERLPLVRIRPTRHQLSATFAVQLAICLRWRIVVPDQVARKHNPSTRGPSASSARNVFAATEPEARSRWRPRRTTPMRSAAGAPRQLLRVSPGASARLPLRSAFLREGARPLLKVLGISQTEVFGVFLLRLVGLSHAQPFDIAQDGLGRLHRERR